jgi:hypothetical protein
MQGYRQAHENHLQDKQDESPAGCALCPFREIHTRSEKPSGFPANKKTIILDFIL